MSNKPNTKIYRFPLGRGNSPAQKGGAGEMASLARTLGYPKKKYGFGELLRKIFYDLKVVKKSTINWVDELPYSDSLTEEQIEEYMRRG